MAGVFITPAIAFTVKPIVANYQPPATPQSIVEEIKAQSIAHNVDPNIMLKIAKCESEYRQFDKDGTVLRGVVNPKDVGVFQINETYHLSDSQRLGYDIYTQSGNIAYGAILAQSEGFKPWVWSKDCWSK